MKIIERLERKSRSNSYVKSAAAEIAALQEISEEEAKEVVHQNLHEIIEAFRSMNSINSLIIPLEKQIIHLPEKE